MPTTGLIHQILAQSEAAELRRRAGQSRLARPGRPPRPRFRRRTPLPTDLFAGRGVTIRYAYPDDEPAIRRLAQLDESDVPTGRVLLAEVRDELWAAAATDGSAPIADPFRPSEAVAGMLLELKRRVAL